MSGLIGVISDTGAGSAAATILIEDFTSPGDIALGPLPEGHILEELKCFALIPIVGATCIIVDGDDNILIPVNKISVSRQGNSSATLPGETTDDIELIARLTGSGTGGKFLFKKTIVRVI